MDNLTIQDVCEWLKSQMYDDDVVHCFRVNDISGSFLCGLTDEKLKSEIGISSYGKRLTILASILLLKNEITSCSLQIERVKNYKKVHQESCTSDTVCKRSYEVDNSEIASNLLVVKRPRGTAACHSCKNVRNDLVYCKSTQPPKGISRSRCTAKYCVTCLMSNMAAMCSMKVSDTSRFKPDNSAISDWVGGRNKLGWCCPRCSGFCKCAGCTKRYVERIRSTMECSSADMCIETAVGDHVVGELVMHKLFVDQNIVK
jgi:hypothetical protein